MESGEAEHPTLSPGPGPEGGAVGSGAFGTIYQSLEYSCLLYQKEVWEMEVATRPPKDQCHDGRHGDIAGCQEPVQGPTVFTDGSGKTGKAIVTWQDGSEWQVLESYEDGSAQLVELRAVVMAFETFSQEPFSLVTDSAYVADIAQRLGYSVFEEVSNPALFNLLKALWCAIQARVHPYYVLHVWSHTNLPGFVAEGNARADKLANPAWVAPQPEVLAQAKASHGFFHQNAHTLQKQFQLTATEAHEIVELCNNCHILGAPLPAGVNPRGLKALELWQTDVTQVAEFGRLKYVHVTVDTFSSAMWASAHTGEKARDVIAHWRQAFAVLGIPSAVKTDSGPAYASQQIMGHAGYLQSVSVLTCDCRGRIRLTGEMEAVINLKVAKWMNPRVMTQMVMIPFPLDKNQEEHVEKPLGLWTGTEAPDPAGAGPQEKD
ncbi:hypothetical protein DUI87_13900 [Hirundo rustica rustica]|uniref:RNA-directed DNA polymerase n=1 Tax=Hirundo rustica rustica TaxID=333673 RepID=A0A3M0K6S5_HIRRU|nr:hypothetical protein DUI87_13900 [Hirundo rustica rustica]